MRTPILLWGDLVKGKKAITRRSLVGNAAHECMYGWVYLTDFLATKRLFSCLEVLKNDSAQKSVISSFDEKVWTLINREKIDPHYQLNKSAFETSCYLNAFIFSRHQKLPIVVELGQTFFTAIDKFNFVYQLSKEYFPLDYEPNQLKWIGIDNSEFCNLTAQVLHEDHKKNIEIYDSLADYSRRENAIFHSRFVCSYAFQTTVDFASFLSHHFECAIIEDAFSPRAEDIHTENHGQSETFFNLQALNKHLSEHQFETYVLDYYGDWPANSGRCLVVKLLIVKKGVFNKEKFQNFLNYHGFKNDMVNHADTDLLAFLMSKISASEWKKIYLNKKVNPVWGKTDCQRTSTCKNLLKRIYYRYKILKSGYKAYNLRGQNAEQEVCRYINEQKNNN